MGKHRKKTEQCPYNEAVGCTPKEGVCEKCGWNPEAFTQIVERLNISEETKEALLKIGQQSHREESEL